MKKQSNIFIGILILIVLALVGYIFWGGGKVGNSAFFNASSTPANIISSTSSTTPIAGGAKTFVFDNFHGSKDLSNKFYFYYPDNWYNDGQYFSPQPISYYDQYSVLAPFYFDLIKTDIFDQTEFNNQIKTDKRRTPDSHGKIGGHDFTRYDLTDYGSYGGDSSGRVIIYVGPKITIDGMDYFLVFHWEEKPLTADVPGNDPATFDKIVQTLTFEK